MLTSSEEQLARSYDQEKASPLSARWPGWYESWIQRQLDAMPFLSIIQSSSLPKIFEQVAVVLREGGSINDIAMRLLSNELIQDLDADAGALAARRIAFAVLGWQTMLYKPAFGVCPPEQLAIDDVLDGYNGNAFMALTQDYSRAKRPIPDFMLGFGLMLPKGNISLSEEKEDQQAFERISLIDNESLNASLLCSLANVHIQWIDVIAPHLEFDKVTNTLFLFRYPSYCLSSATTPEDTVLHNSLLE